MTFDAFTEHSDVTVAEEKIRSFIVTEDENKKATSRKRRRSCGKCVCCLAKDCRSCKFCRDMPKYGGPNKLKKKCAKRTCRNMT